MHHVAVGDRARAAGVVAGHAAERRLRAGRDVDRIPEAVRLQLRVEVVEHEARLDRRPCVASASKSSDACAGACCCRSPAPRRWSGRTGWCRRRAAAPAPSGRARCRARRRRRRSSRGTNTPTGIDLVDRGVGRVAAARGGVEQHLALDLARSLSSSVLTPVSLLLRPRPSAISRSRCGCAWRTRPAARRQAAPLAPSRSSAPIGLQSLGDFGIHAIDDRLRRALDRPQAVPGRDIQPCTPTSAAVGMSGNRRPLRRRRRQPDQAAAGSAGRGADAVEHHVDLAGQQVLHRRARAAIGHMGDLRPGLELEELAREMMRRAGAGRSVVHLAGVLRSRR